jgi:hypothetical protein
MKKTALILGCTLLALAGCKGSTTTVSVAGTASNPGGTAPKKMVLSGPESVEVHPGSTKSVTVKVTREQFDEPVTIIVAELPEGVTVVEKDVRIDKGAAEAKFTLSADKTAATDKEATFKVSAKGGDVVAEDLKIKVKVVADPDVALKIAALKKAIQPGLDNADKAIKDLKVRAKDASGDTKKALDEQIAKLQEQRDKFKEQMDKAQSQSAGTWDDFAKGLHKAADNLKTTVNKALEQFKTEDRKLTLAVPAAMTVAPGATEEYEIKVKRQNVDAPVKITFAGLPEGVKLVDKEVTIAKGQDGVKFKLQADAKAKEVKDAKVKVTAEADGVKDEREVTLTVAPKGGAKLGPPMAQKSRLPLAIAGATATFIPLRSVVETLDPFMAGVGHGGGGEDRDGDHERPQNRDY